MTNAGPPGYSAFQLALILLAGLVLLCIAAPLASLILNTPIADVARTAADEEVRASIWLSLWTAMAATLVAAFGALPLAWLLARRRLPASEFLSAIVDLPIVIPHSAAGIALLGLFSREAFVGGAADTVGLRFIGDELGIIAAMAFVSVPYLLHAARDGFAAVPERLERAALNLGASPARVFFTISIPLAWRSVVSGMVLMWGRGMSEFGAVMIVAYRPMVTPILLWERYSAFGLAYARPVAVVLLGVALVTFIAARLLAGRGHAAR